MLTRSSRSKNRNTGTGNSGAVGTMWTRQGKNAKKIQEYIQCQYEQDKAGEQLTQGMKASRYSCLGFFPR